MFVNFTYCPEILNIEHNPSLIGGAVQLSEKPTPSLTGVVRFIYDVDNQNLYCVLGV